VNAQTSAAAASRRVPITLDPALDPDVIRPVFERYGRIHLPGVFAPAAAGEIWRNLVDDVPWMRSTLLGGRPCDLPNFESWPPEMQADYQRRIHDGAGEGFQYDFDSYRVSSHVLDGTRHGWMLEDVYDFLNSRTFLDFVARMTGDRRGIYVDAQATRYRPGHFLTTHTDEAPGKGRLFAYVLNFTPVWRLDWGGLLVFRDQDGHVAEGYTPAFNALNIFRVPQDHAVTPVAPYARGDRLSITGWIRTARDEPTNG
jgi:hypothetical protein